ncbi:hypothetical protein [Massilia eburnea]|uniref:hypothetical protein n=1 Tax=Massilia eburnea TaxID=1776165 RepID=UPI003D6C4DE4
MKKPVKALAVTVAAFVLLLVLVSLNYALIMIALTFSVGLAIAGPANWLRWTATFAAVSALSGAIVEYGLPKLLPEGVISGLVLCGLMPLTPAFMLWLAHLIHKHSARRPPAT